MEYRLFDQGTGQATSSVNDLIAWRADVTVQQGHHAASARYFAQIANWSYPPRAHKARERGLKVGGKNAFSEIIQQRTRGNGRWLREMPETRG